MRFIKYLMESWDSPLGFNNRYDHEEFAQRLGALSARGEPMRAKNEMGQNVSLRFDRESQQWVHEGTGDTFDTEELSTLLSQDDDGQYWLAY